MAVLPGISGVALRAALFLGRGVLQFCRAIKRRVYATLDLLGAVRRGSLYRYGPLLWLCGGALLWARVAGIGGREEGGGWRSDAGGSGFEEG